MRGGKTPLSLKPTDFLGNWALERRIDDVLSGSVSTFSGTACLSVGENQWSYHEVGKLLLADAQPMTAERRYIWRADDNGVDIHFDDGRFFHRLDCSNDAVAQHWCDPDQYDVEYNFSNWPKWQNTWSVRGPKKNYTMTSAYMTIL